MATENLILTALPNGRGPSGELKVTIFVSPRLSTDGPDSLPLSNFPAFADWPATVARLRQDSKFEIEFEGVDRVMADPDPDSEKPDSHIWQLIFDENDVGVTTGAFKDLSERRVLSYPASEVARQVMNLYRDVAVASPTSFPPVTTGPLVLLGRNLGLLADVPGEFYGSLDGMIKRNTPGGKKGRFLDRRTLSGVDADRLAFVQAQRFYDRPNTRDPLGKDQVPPPPDPPRIDFHGYCSSLGDYPRLLRPLGLAIDLVLKAPAGLKTGGRIRLHIPTPPADLQLVLPEEARPWTRFEQRDRRFIPRPRDEEQDLADGTLRLENDKLFSVHQVDVDGSALKTIHFAANLRRLHSHLTSGERSMTENEASLPALRTGGFIVARGERDRSLVGHIDAGVGHEADHASGDPADLWAEDVTRGYRPDVFDDKSGAWHSLTARDGTYTVARAGGPTPVPVKPDEGFVKGASATSVPDETEADLYLHESVFGWDGWSLVAKRPGQSIVDNAGQDVGTVDPKPPDDFPLVTQFQPVPGTLPRLRFGRTYRFRARAVDLAGNSVPEADLVAQHQSKPQLFQRFDPVPSPAVVPRKQFTEGESLMRMVIRSTLNVMPAAYVALPRVTGLAGHGPGENPYLDLNERHLAAPKTSVQLAEWHAMFDAAIGRSAAQSSIDDQFDIAAKESGSFMLPGPGVHVVSAQPTPTDLTTLEKGGALASGEYVVHDVDNLELPYLPDPLSAGPSLSILPGDSGARTITWTGGGWPDSQPFRIRIVDGGKTTDPQKAVDWKPNLRLLTVFLRQAELVTVRVSSFPAGLSPAVNLDVMGVWNLLPAANKSSQLTAAKQGRQWMLTPYSELTIVHAVEKPLTPPVVAVDSSGVGRNGGETFAVLTGRVDNHAKSTGRLDIDATWTEQVDDLVKDFPNDGETGNLGRIDGAGHIVDFLLEASENGCRIGRDDAPASGATPTVHKVRHEFGDTRHRTVDYRATATTRFREYFPPAITDDPDLITHAGPTRTLDIPSSRRPDPPEVLYVIPTFKWVDDSFRGILAGLKADVLQPKTATAISAIRGGRLLFDRGVRESAIKLPADVRLPGVTRRIRTAGLRVYLKRPWYSSGDGELLAVVVPDQPYFSWPLDIGRGLKVGNIARAIADEAAKGILSTGRIKGAAGARLTPTEQLVGGLQKLTNPDAGDEADTAQAFAFTTFQNMQLAGLLGGIQILFKSGDPEKWVTRWASDPIWGSDIPSTGPWIHQFPLRTEVGTGLSLLEAPGHSVAAVGHKPKFDPIRGLWYCDIDIDLGTSYFPFVRLGLARYQPSSIPGMHLSRVVAPEWAQIPPARTASMTRPSGSAATVTLRGPAGYTDLAEGILGNTTAAGQQGMELSRFAVAQVERLPAGATTDLAWVPAGDEVHLPLEIVKPYSDIRFKGTVQVPRSAAGEQLRLTIREYEYLQTDASQAEDVFAHNTFTLGDVPPPEVGAPHLDVHPDDRPVRLRLVYADHLPI